MHVGMAASSTNSTGAAAAATTIPTIAATSTPIKPLAAVAGAANSQQHSETPKTQRGQNKPKCIKCGNVARSRCPFHSCKSCCSKDQNPCHIHVLKSNGTSLEKTPSTSSPSLGQKSTDVHTTGTSHRVPSFRQLSNSFAQFNNVHSPFRSRKPLTRKDATAINEWRFSKLKEYKDRTVEGEDEAFDRYMWNINLLEEVFCVRNEVPAKDEFLKPNPTITSSVEDKSGMVCEMNLKLRSNPIQSASFRNRIQEIVHRGLLKLKKCELKADADGMHGQHKPVGRAKRAKTWNSERHSLLNDLNDKLNKARNEEDLKSCLKMKSALFKKDANTDQAESEDVEMSEETQKNDLVPGQPLQYSPPKLFRSTEIDQEILNGINTRFNSLQQIGDL